MGRPEFDRRIDIRAQSLPSLTSNIESVPSESIEPVDAAFTGTVAAGSGAGVFISPPTGYLYSLQAFHYRLNPPTGATTGDHTLKMKLQSSAGDIALFSVTYAYSDTMEYTRGEWLGTPSVQYPSSASILLERLRGLRMDANSTLYIQYLNNTDGTQDNTPIGVLWSRKIKV